jgi:O-antigen ligase
MAMTTALPLPFVLTGLIRSREPAARLLWGLALAAAGAGLLLTYVRAGWLTAVVGLILVLVLARRGRAILPVILLIALLAGLMFAAGLIDVRAMQERLQADQPIDYRMNAINVGLAIAGRSPLLGLGLDNYSDAALAAGWRPTGGQGLPAVAPHNLFIYILTSAGLLALLPFLAMLGSIGLRLLQALRALPASSPQRDWVIASLAMLAGYLLIGNTFDALGAQLANMIFFTALGATFAAVDGRAGGTKSDGEDTLQFVEPAL